MNTTRQLLKENFEKVLNRLNEEQRLAVDHIDGPVMVIAGPGTGKTQILAARIGNILNETDTQAENILCLTYTEAGTIAMRQRLQSFIGSDAYKVRVNTFHAFCNEVIQEHLHVFKKNELEPVSDLERLEIIKQITEELPKGNVLKRYRGDVDYEIKNLSSFYETMKRERWSPEDLIPAVHSYVAELPQREAFIYKRGNKKKGIRKGDPNPKKIKEEERKMKLTLAAVETFNRYEQLMDQRGRYDFSDMINWVIDAFDAHPDLLAAYREQFLYILVDEFQDTSGSQNQLLQKLCGEEDNPNVFVVGDDDQSIFRFQGANVENMVNFATRYVEYLKTVVLTVNYRSVQSILDASQAVIKNNKERLVNQLDNLKKILTAGNPALEDSKLRPCFLDYQNTFSEMAGITYAIEDLLENKKVSPEKIAVIYRNNKYGEELSRYFQAKNIPYFIKKKIDILQEPFIKKLLSVLEYVASELDIPYSGDNLLFEILHYEYYGIPAYEIARLMSAVSLLRGEKKKSFRAYLQEWLQTKNPELFTQQPHDAILKAVTLLEKRIKDAVNKTLLEFIEIVIRENGFLTFALRSNEKVWYMQLLTSFFDFVKAETQRNPDLTLIELLSTLALMKNNDLGLTINRNMETEEGVHLLTVHGSKGLEYEVVFLAGCESDKWEKSRGTSRGYKIPDTLIHSTGEEHKVEENRRLFFVGMTRAEKELFITRGLNSNEGKEKEASRFLAEIKEEMELPEEKPLLSEEQLVHFAALNFTEIKQHEIQHIEQQFIEDLLSKFSMNVTALNNYLECPLKFYYNNLIRVPSGKSEAMEFGSAIHYALEQLFRKMQDNDEDGFPPVKNLLSSFHYYMKRNRQHFTKAAFDRRSEYGETILTDYYNKYVNTWNKVVSVERRFNNIVVEGIPLKGAMDKLEFEGSLVNVVDYKTGNVDSRYTKDKLKSPSEKEPIGGNYWRQAVFYKILLDHYHQKDWQVMSTEFDFVEPNKEGEFIKARIDIKPQDIAIVLQQIHESWEKIQNHEFYIGCGEEDCYWCNFAKENHLAAVPEEGEV